MTGSAIEYSHGWSPQISQRPWPDTTHVCTASAQMPGVRDHFKMILRNRIEEFVLICFVTSVGRMLQACLIRSPAKALFSCSLTVMLLVLDDAERLPAMAHRGSSLGYMPCLIRPSNFELPCLRDGKRWRQLIWPGADLGEVPERSSQTSYMPR